MSDTRILFICLDFLTWKRARQWSYTVQLALEEGFIANGISVVTVPSIHEIPSNSKASFLNHISELCTMIQFDQVWIELVHNNIDDDFLAFLVKTIPVRVGIIAESLQYAPAAYDYEPVLLQRRSQVIHRLQFMTHALVVDEADETDINANSYVKALWWPQAVPSRFIVDQISRPKLHEATFCGEVYGNRREWLDSPLLHNLLTRLPSSEQGTNLPQQFDQLNALVANTLLNTTRLDMQLLTNYSESLRALRQYSFSLWLESLRAGIAVVNLPSFFQGYAGRIYEGMAAGRPVISWHVASRPRTSALFSENEILLFPDDRPDALAELIRRVQSDEHFGASIAEKALSKIRQSHTTERRVAQILEWIESGVPPHYLPVTETTTQTKYTLPNGHHIIFPESCHAHYWLDGLTGLEIGPSTHNPFGLMTRNVGMRDNIYEAEQLRLTGTVAELHIEARADAIPVPDESENFIISSHVIEHCPDLIKTLLEWFRIVKVNGFIYMIVPHRNAAPTDVGRPLTDWQHIYEDYVSQADEHSEPEAGRFGHCHYHVFETSTLIGFIELIFGDGLRLIDRLEQDDKIGSGFTLVYRKMVSNAEFQYGPYMKLSFEKQKRDAGSETNLFVNIGMVTFNRLEFTRQSIEALVRHTIYPYRLTVIDNSSQDGTREFLQEQQRLGTIKNLILLDENVGVAKASNLAWSLEPDADYYLKLDNDIVVQKTGWLARIVEVAEALPEAGAIAYNFEPVSYPEYDLHGFLVRPKNGSLGGACVLIPQRTHALLGYWCEEYGLYGEEDADYGIRIMQAGLLNIYMNDENVGLHLPAGKAAVIDSLTMITSDGGEEESHAEYRAWKDALRRKNVLSGHLARNLEKYFVHSTACLCDSPFVEDWYAFGGKLPMPLKVAVFSIEQQGYACNHYRVEAPFRYLAGAIISASGIRVENNVAVELNLEAAHEADIILAQRFFPCEANREIVTYLLSLGKPVVYDTDDLLFAVPSSNPHYGWASEQMAEIKAFIRRCSAVTVSTEELRQQILPLQQKVYLLPNLLDSNLWRRPVPHQEGPVTIGYVGSNTHAADLVLLEEVLETVAQVYGDRVAFRFFGCKTERLAQIPGFSFMPFVQTFNDYAELLQQSGIDIVLVPLEDTPFNRCKSNVKWLECSACGIAGIYSDLPPYADCVEHGVTGMLVGPEPEQWIASISLLVERVDLRREIANNARCKVLKHYDQARGCRRLLRLYRQLAGTVEPIESSSRLASIIIPAFNQAALTRKCLNALLAEKREDVEIVVIDNGSTDWTPEYLASLGGTIRLVTNTTNLGFAKACNQGAAAAKGRYLIFLNNDTVPQHGWLDALLAPALSGIADIVGARLLYPDGTIQHAGVVFDEQGPLHCFKRMPSDTPGANQPRYLQAVTAACMLLSAQLFQQLGGFDEEYTNGFEDVDLCLTAVQQGYRVYYQPDSLLIHYEESSQGRKLHDEENYARFLRRWLGHWRIDYKPDPLLISVIIPVFNQLAYTRNCLDKVFATTQQLAGRIELIVVDNGSSDGTAEYLQTVKQNVQVVYHQQNLGFSKGCNSGAQVAKGSYLVFLNNDTEACVGWLEALLAVFEQEQRVGIVGSKLLFPDGTIQHAGVTIVRDPYLPAEISPCHLGYRKPDGPEYEQMRECQAITAACMMIPNELFRQLGGFDEGYWNGFEDVDLCFKVHEAGYRIVYQPASVVIHHESKSGNERKEAELQNLKRLQDRWAGRIQPEYLRVSPDRVEPLGR